MNVPTFAPRRRLGLYLLGLCALVSLAQPVLAQPTYPNGTPIRVVVPSAPGGASDIMMRLIAQKMAESMKNPVVVDNRAGAGNVIGTTAVAKSPADGYTLLLTYTDHVFNPYLHANLPFDTLKDFSPVGLIGSSPMLLVAPAGLAVNSVGELIAMARSQPGKLNFASAGSGSSLHLAGELFKAMARIDVTHVPYKGTAPAFIDLLGGRVEFMFPTSVSAATHVQSGKIKVLATTTPQRLAAYPQVPTVAEAGLPGYEASIWYALLAPAGTPAPIVERLNAELRRALEHPEVRSRLLEQNFTLQPGSPEDLGRLIVREHERWGKVIRDANVRL